MSADEGKFATDLASRLAGRGPMPFRDYMAEALYADELGYYTRRDLRRRGDRPTSRPGFVADLVEPVAQAFVSFAEDHPPRLVDHGPGAGLLVRYLLGSLPERIRADVDVTFVEPRLARRTRLLVLLQEFGVDGRVVSAPRDAEPGPAFVVARELLGSFPVHWLERTGEGWREIHVDAPGDTWTPKERLEDAPPQLTRFVDDHLPEVPVGHRYEVNLHLRRWLAQLQGVVDPGLVYVLDRPIERPPSPEGSIRAVREGETVDVYEAPGITDISSGVDLDVLVSQAEKAGFVDATADTVGSEGGRGPLAARVLRTR
jgi:SAM-dependent MidA family methyltransferase